MEIKGVLERTDRSKELTEREMKTLKMTMQKLALTPKQQICYNLSSKESKSGFFSNERLLVLNTREKELFYISKLPEGLIPFLNVDEVNSLKFKNKVTRDNILKGEVTDFKCNQAPGKVSTFEVKYKKGGAEDISQYTMGNSKLMNQWVELINKVLVIDEPRPKTPEKKPQEPKVQANPPPQPPPEIPRTPSGMNRPYTESKKILHDNVVNEPYQASKPMEPYPSSKQIKQNPSNRNILPPPDYSAIPQQNSIPPYYQSNSLSESKIANMPYSDHVGELKYLRKANPNIFNTSNQLSRPNLHQQDQAQNYNRMNGPDDFQPTKISFAKKEYPEPAYDDRDSYRDAKNIGNPYSRVSDSERSNRQSRVQPNQREGSRRNLQNSQLITEQMPKSRSGLSKANDPYSYRDEQQPNNEYKRMASNFESDKNQPQIKINPSNSRNLQSGKISRSRDQQMIKQPSSHYLNPQPVSNNYSSKDRMDVYEENEPIHRNSRKTLNAEARQPSRQQLRVPSNNRAGWRDQNQSERIMSGRGSQYMNKPIINQGPRNNINSKKTFNRKKWNQIFAQTNNRLEVYEDFMHTCHNIVREIINQLPMDKNQRQYLPIEIKPPFFTYYDEGILITLHYFQNAKNISTSVYSSEAPLLYDQSTYELLKREFYNYNLILSVTSNEGFIKVPLCTYFQYKGIIALCKAEIPDTFSDVTPKRFQKQFDIIENQIHVRFMYGSFNSYLHPNSKYIIVDNMRELIPEIPLFNKEKHFFRKEFLLGFQQIIEDMESCNQANYHITQNTVPEFLSKLESLETYVVNSSDLLKICHDSGLSLAYLPLLAQQAKSPYIKKIFTTELVSVVFVSIFRSELNHLFATFPNEQFSDLTLDAINGIILDSCHTLIELMFGYSNGAENIWRIIVEQCSTKYKLAVSKEDVIAGYLLGSIVQRIGLVCDFRRSAFNKHNVEFFVKSGNIPKDLLAGFKMKIRRYDLSSISPLVRDIEDILYTEPNAENFKNMVKSLNLRQQSLPTYLQNIEPAILTYMCNFVPYSQHEEFQHIGIYNMVIMEPHSYYSTKLSLLAVKWCIKKKLIDEAFKIYEMKEVENAFWLGQYNPAISQFYDFFSMYHASIGKYEQAINLAKLSLKNIMKVLGINELPVADKHYQLGNIYFKMGRKEESLKQYTRTKQILVLHKQVHISQFAIILLKLAVLYLNFGKISDCVNNSLEALKIFDQNHGNEQDEIGTFEVLARSYEITKKNNELLNIGQMVAQKFNDTEDMQIFERTAKIVLYIRLKNLSSAESKSFLSIITKLELQNSVTNPVEAFTFLHRKCQNEVLLKKVANYLDNIVALYEQSSKKDLFRRYKSLDHNTKTEAEEMLVIFDALGLLIGYGYMIGSLKDLHE